VKVLHPPQNSVLPVWNALSCGIKHYGVEVTGITCVPNFIQIHQSVEKLLGDSQTDRHTDWLVILQACFHSLMQVSEKRLVLKLGGPASDCVWE
jgi:hypothetical protein